MIYVNLRDFSDDLNKVKLYKLSDYLHIHNLLTVPAVIVEAENIASQFPLVWQRVGDEMVFVALMGLEPGDNQFLKNECETDTVPLLALKAYPFVAGRLKKNGSESSMLIDDAPVKASIMQDSRCQPQSKRDEEISRRLAAARIFAHSKPHTDAISQRLVEADVLQPWRFGLQFKNRAISIEGLYILNRNPQVRYSRIKQVLQEIGHDAIRIAELHELSLFRMQQLSIRHAEIIA